MTKLTTIDSLRPVAVHSSSLLILALSLTPPLCATTTHHPAPAGEEAV